VIKDRLLAGVFVGVVFSASLFLAFEAGRGGQLPSAFAENGPVSQGDHSYTAFSGFGSSNNGSVEDLVLVDAKTNKLGIYTMKGGQLELVAVRSLEFDFKLAEYGKQSPGAKVIKEALDKEEKERQKAEKDKGHP
jgi:hypothetical protein